MDRSSPDLVVDAMNEGDVAAVAAIDSVSFPSTSSEDTPARASKYREELARPWSHSWVIRDAGDSARVLAFVVVWYVVDEVHVLNIATDPRARRRGLGTTLVRTVIDFARAEGAKQMLLEVRRSNLDAIRLYRGAGFFVQGVRRRYYPDDEDAIEMALVLDPTTGNVVRREDEARLDA
jgi:ribosomal-protein-alanine N-acetyltransferase